MESFQPPFITHIPILFLILPFLVVSLNQLKYYTQLLIENKLQEHLTNIDIISNKRFELLMEKFMKQENITEELKTTNQMEWVSKMNSIKKLAEEIIFNELIYV